jgi:predicted DNA binding CopG/RHH family protein/uncharacterized protein YwgA
LPEGPEIVPRPKTAQITLRVPLSLLARIKRVAAARTLPYHALARSWIIDGIRRTDMSQEQELDIEPQTVQLNLKLDSAVLDGLKARAHEMHEPYHRLARQWITWEVEQAERALGLGPISSFRPAIKELMVLLLHAQNARGETALRGMTRLQKLLFVIEQKLASQTSFYAYNYGPFNEEVNDAAKALEVAGFIRSAHSASSGAPSFQQMMAAVTERAGRQEATKPVSFELNKSGHEAAEKLRTSSSSYEQLFAFVEAVRREWDTPDLTELVDRVYSTWPEYAEKSVIRNEVSVVPSSNADADRAQKPAAPHRPGP